jgi:hypothetical protein
MAQSAAEQLAESMNIDTTSIQERCVSTIVGVINLIYEKKNAHRTRKIAEKIADTSLKSIESLTNNGYTND